MNDLDDIKYAVIDTEAADFRILGFFGTKEDAEKCAAALSDDPDEPLDILVRGEGFHIDIHVTTASSFDVYA